MVLLVQPSALQVVPEVVVNANSLWIVVRELDSNEPRVVSVHETRWQAEQAARVFREVHPVAVAGSARFRIEEWGR